MKWIWLPLCACVAALLLGGCGTSKAGGEPVRTVTDAAGRNVSLPVHPQRIVSLTYGTDEILAGLVEENRIAAFCKYAGDEDITFISKEQASRVGKVEMSPEAVMALQPDLVLASTAVDQNVVDVLSSSGVPVYVSGIPSTVEGMKNKVMGVAEAVNEEEKGRAMTAAMDNDMAALEEKLSAIPEDQERTALGLSFRGILGKQGTLFADVLAKAHVKDGAAAVSVPKGTNAYLSLEILPRINPDVILMPTWRVKSTDDPAAFTESLLSNPAFQDVTAVKEHHLVPFPEKYKYVMSQHVTEAVRAAAEAVYPELFETAGGQA